MCSSVGQPGPRYCRRRRTPRPLSLPAGQFRSHSAQRCPSALATEVPGRQWGNTSAPSYRGEMSMNRETGVLMTACTQPGCIGTIVDGYCDVCGMIYQRRRPGLWETGSPVITTNIDRQHRLRASLAARFYCLVCFRDVRIEHCFVALSRRQFVPNTARRNCGHSRLILISLFLCM